MSENDELPYLYDMRMFLKDDIDELIVDLWDDYGMTFEEANHAIYVWMRHYLREDENDGR